MNRSCIGRTLTARRHRENHVLPFFVIESGHAEMHLAVLQTKTHIFSDGKRSRMFCIPGNDSIRHIVCCEHVFRAESLRPSLAGGINASSGRRI